MAQHSRGMRRAVHPPCRFSTINETRETMISRTCQALVAAAFLFPGGYDASAAQGVVSGEFVGAIPDSDPSDPLGVQLMSWWQSWSTTRIQPVHE